MRGSAPVGPTPQQCAQVINLSAEPGAGGQLSPWSQRAAKPRAAQSSPTSLVISPWNSFVFLKLVEFSNGISSLSVGLITCLLRRCSFTITTVTHMCIVSCNLENTFTSIADFM